MRQGDYYAIVTRRFRLQSNHDDWLEKTQGLYNELLLFYYRLFLRHPFLHTLPSRDALRSLEQLTVVGRDRRPVPYPLPWQKVPLYFRRAAINAAIAAGKSFLAREEQKEETESFSKSVTFYKGTYRDFDEKGISLKVWDGEAWRWLRCRLRGNRIREGEEALSPSVICGGKYLYLDMPVKAPVADRRDARQRMAEGTKLCCVQFTNRDAVAVCCILGPDGRMESSRFLRGGKEYARACGEMLEGIRHSRESRGGTQGGEPADRRYWEGLRHLNAEWSHRLSSQVVGYCREGGASLLVLPKYGKEYTGKVMKGAGTWSPVGLGRSVGRKLKYKAWKEGILVLEEEVSHASSRCAACGAGIRKEGTGFTCANGHKGDKDLNFARNLGLKCLASFGNK